MIKKINLKILAGLAALATLALSCSNDATVCSPDGTIRFAVEIADGVPYYSVEKNGEAVLAASRLGFELRDDQLGAMEIAGVKTSRSSSRWEQPWGERRVMEDRHREMLVNLRETTGAHRTLGLRVRVFDDGFGFRYEFGEKSFPDSLVIMDELTEFAFASAREAWWMNREDPYFEEYGVHGEISQIDTALTPLVVLAENGNSYAIHEAALTDYAKMNLTPSGEGTLKAMLTPWANGVKVYARAPFTTPWRTMIIAPEQCKMIESTLMLNLNEPSKINDCSWIRPGKYVGIWWSLHKDFQTWYYGPRHGATTENTKEYIDFAAENGFSAVLVEGWNKGWDGNWMKNSKGFSFTEAYPDYDFDEVTSYARSKGVQMVVHNEYAADMEHYFSQIEDAYQMYEDAGMHYVKTGNVNILIDGIEQHDGQYAVRRFRKIVETAAAHKICIDEHEPPIPTGIARTWPNLMTHEAVRGQEHDAWELDGGNKPEHTTVLPYLRGLAGPADFTFGTFNFDNPNYPFCRVRTTLAKQLAQYVVVYSPLQMASDEPWNYKGKGFDFIRDVPADWERTVGVDGVMGDYIVTARQRRGGDDWFLGALTDENARDLQVKLDFLAEGVNYIAQVYADGPDASFEENPTSLSYTELLARKGDVLPLHLATSGGAAVRFVPAAAPAASKAPLAKETAALAQRLIPQFADRFDFRLCPAEGDSYTISTDGGRILIEASNENSAAVALNRYLKEYCKTDVSWYAYEKVQMPSMIPALTESVSASALVPERFFLNYCTFGYTMPWWKWEDWERFIDWMALNGVNMPLAITGQEAIWQKVWKKYGMSDEQIRSYFTGPAHLPWHRMNNIDKWQGPLPQSWLDNQLALQKKILKRERALGMKPVLPAFAGHVPAEIAEKFPDADISRLSFWGGFADEYRCNFLSPTDPLYQKIQKDFLAEQTRQFGTDHIYGVDLFNEVDAPSWEPEVLAGMARDVYRSLTDNDPQATWLQMGWLFYADQTHWTDENIEAYLRAVPQDKVVMLDYFCEFTQIWTRTESFYGQPYIWCYLGNFGGNTAMTGNLRECGRRFGTALSEGGENLSGIGSTLEGFGVNLPAFEYILDLAWDNCKGYDEWLEDLADRRLGRRDENMRRAWKALGNDIYKVECVCGQSNLVCARPRADKKIWWTTSPMLGFSSDEMLRIWKDMLECPSDRESYLTDLANVGREYLGRLFYDKWSESLDAYARKDLEASRKVTAEMLEIIEDMDALMATRPEFSLKRWIEDARAFGINDEEKDYYEKNARTLVSVWGGDHDLNDYASRAWAGLLDSYYKVRWEMYAEEMAGAIAGGRDFDSEAFEKACMNFEWGWTEPSYKIEFPAEGDALELSRELMDKYSL